MTAFTEFTVPSLRWIGDHQQVEPDALQQHRRERQFGLLKSWATTVAPTLWPVLGDRYVLYSEWLYAKHTLFYDALPHYFCAFDVLDSST